MTKRYTVLPGTLPEYQCGDYVRMIGKDMGTGVIHQVHQVTMLDPKTQKVHHQIAYQVRWLDMKDKNGGIIHTMLGATEITKSSRAVPQFTDPEEAAQWMEKQLAGGHWTGGAQDAVDSASDLDVALWNLIDEENKNE